MNLLPKSSSEFSTTQYWNEFFSKRGPKAFDWYGEYTELCGILHKYTRKTDQILMSGCGNSTISADLYKVGYNDITNIDISEVVISQMKNKYEKSCPLMKWLHGDMLNLKYENESFSSIIDKGTLDALMSEQGSQNSNHNQYFQEINRIMKIGGRYICISLLQEHILNALLEWFPSNGWIVRICRCVDAEKKQTEDGKFSFPVFVIILTKFRKMESFSPIFELCLSESGDIRRVKNACEIKESITSLQQYSLLKHNLRNKKIDEDEIKLELCDAKSGTVRYRIFIVDSPKISNSLKFAVFIVPNGRESEWLFNTREGQIQLADSASANRLAIVHLMRDQIYDSLQAVQNELSDKVPELAPLKMRQKKIPFLSVGQDLGERKEVYRGHSSFSGEFFIEDVTNESDDFTLRRLIFMSNLNLVQTEAKLIKVRKSRKLVIDARYLSCTHHSLMVASLQLVSYDSSVLLIGLGGGSLATFMHNNFPTTITAVDIDKSILDVAVNYFDFKTTTRLDCKIDDGIDFIEREAKDGNKYDLIMFDVDSKTVGTGLSCPPQTFLATTFLDTVASCLTDRGLFVSNLVCRDKTLKKSILEDVKGVYPSIAIVAVPEEVNDVIFCSLNTNYKWDIETKFKELNQYFKNKFRTKDVFIDFREIVNNINYL